MATMEDLEEHIRCAICLETFTNPYELTCQHSFCLECVHNLESQSVVKCPECRSECCIDEVKKDFKLQRLVDLYCKNEHSDSNIKDLHMTLKISISGLEKEKQNIQSKCQRIDETMKVIYENQMKQEADIELYARSFIKSIEENWQLSQKHIRDVTQRCIKQLDKHKQIYNECCSDIQSKIDSLKEKASTNDIKALTELVNSFSRETAIVVENLVTHLPRVETNINPPATVVLGENWGPENGIRVKVDGLFHAHYFPVSFSHLSSSQYDLQKSKQLGYPIYSITKIENELWGVGDNLVCIFNNNCQVIRKHTYHNIQNANDIAYSQSGHIFIACYNSCGLIQLDYNGKFIKTLAEGSFSGVCTFENQAFVLEYNLRQVMVFNFHQNVWRKEKVMQLDSSVYKSCSEDRIKVTGQGIYISSYSGHCLLHFSTVGCYRNTMGMNGCDEAGELHSPYLCDVDNEGNALVADKYNKRLHLKSRGKWYIIKLMGKDPGYPYDAVVDPGSGDIWVVTWSCLLRYKKTYKA